MIKPRSLKKGDKVAIVSLSSGILGESKCKHQLELGVKRLREVGLTPVFMPNALKGTKFIEEHPEARAKDLKDAFFDPSIKGIFCAIGGDETYKLLPYLINDQPFIDQVKKTPKLFTGFSDTTNNHLFFYKLGMTTYYGLNYLSDLAELEDHMLPYTKNTLMMYFKKCPVTPILSSPIWYEERERFSSDQVGIKRISHEEKLGYHVLHGHGKISGRLLGGCLESLYDGYVGKRYKEQKEIYETYHLMPSKDEWKDKVMFFETSEETPTPDLFRDYLKAFEERGFLAVIKAMLVGKPQNERYFKEYNEILSEYAKKYHLPIMVNLNIGHAYPRTVLPYGLHVEIDFDLKKVSVIEPYFAE